MKYGYARVSTDGQSVAAQVAALNTAGAAKVFREVASGISSGYAQAKAASVPSARRKDGSALQAYPASAALGAQAACAKAT